jgi:hypothetical protein
MTRTARPAPPRPSTDRPVDDATRPPGRPFEVLEPALAAVTVAAAAGTVFVDGVLRGPAVMQGSARGTALVMLLVAVPALLVATWFARRGSASAVLVRLGACGYLTYNAVMLLFGTPFNRLFLLYVGVLGLSVGGLVTRFGAVDADRIAARFSPAPARALAAYLAVVVAGNALMWLRIVVPDLGASATPAHLEGTGLTTSPLYVQDLAFWLPVGALAARWLWHRRPYGFVVAGAYLVTWLIEAIGVVSDQWFGSHADPTSTVATMGGAYLFVVVAVLDAVAVALFFRRRSTPAAGGRPNR